MIPKKNLNIIELLKSKTINNQAIWNLKWEEGGIIGFEIKIDNFSASLTEFYYADGQPGYIFEICDNSQMIIESCKFKETTNSEDFKMITEFHDIIMFNHSKEDFLDAIINRLGEDCTIGEKISDYALISSPENEEIEEIKDLPF